MESKIPQANRRPKFRLEEVSPLDLIKICGGFVVAFVLVSTVWILTAEEMDNPRKTWLLKPCHSDGNDFENETSLDIFSLAGRCIIASPSTPFESDEALPLRLGLDFTTYGGALYQTHVQFSAIGIGTQDLLYDGQVTKVQGEPAENTGTTFGMGCGPGATADTASHCYLDQDVIYEDRRPLQLDWSVSFTVINAPPLLFNMTQSVGVFSVTTNRGFEYQELIVRYLLLVVAGIVAAVFYYQIGYSRLNYPWHAWAHEQKWTFVLLVLLIGFDNPFIFLKLGDTSETSQKGMWLFVDVCFRYTFLIGYFFAVLSMTDHMAQTKKKTPTEFYRPKILLFVPCWCLLVYNALQPKSKRTGGAITSTLLVTVLAVIIAVYLFWLFYLIVTMVHKAGNTVGTNVNISWRFKILWSLNVVMIAGFSAALYRVNAWGFIGTEFILGYVGFNFYVFFLAVMFGPAYTSMPHRPPASMPQEVAEVDINDEYEVDDDY